MGDIKHKILDIFFKKELKDYFDAVEKIKGKAEYEIQRIQSQVKIKTEMLDIVTSVLNERNHVIVGFSKNKLDDEVFVVQWIYNDNIWFMLYSIKYRAVNNHPRIMAKIERPSGGTAYIHIDDILTQDKNIGNGSILMPYFLDYCRKTDAQFINGELSYFDKGHFERSEFFYKKHGFTVMINKERTCGRIKLDLQ